MAERSYVIPARVRRRRAFFPGFVGSLSGQFWALAAPRKIANSQVIGVRFVWLGRSVALSQLKT